MRRRLLCPSTTLFSPVSGGEQVLALAPGSTFAGQLHLVPGSVSGASPRLPIGSVTLPLVAADADVRFTLANPGIAPLPMGFGALDADGRAVAGVVVPAGVLPMIGQHFAHASPVLDPRALDPVVFAGDAAGLSFRRPVWPGQGRSRESTTLCPHL